MFFLKELPSDRMIEGYAEHMATDSVVPVREALYMMRHASLLVRQIEQYLGQEGLSQLRFLILIVIDREPERDWLLQKEIVERLDVSKPVLTRTVGALLAAGLLEGVPDDADGRATRLSLTVKAQEQLTRLLPGYYEVITRFMSEKCGH